MVGFATLWRSAAACCAILALGLLAPGPTARAASINTGSGLRIRRRRYRNWSGTDEP